jgi:hypothetical protein
MEVLMMRLLRVCALATFLLSATSAFASFHMYRIEQMYSNAGGTVQFIVLHEVAGFNGENLWMGHTLTSTQPNATRVYLFPNNLPGGPDNGYGTTLSQTANTRVLVATEGFAALGLVTPDYVVPNGFLATSGGTVNYAGVDQVTYASLPTDGTHAIDRNGAVIQNVATNFAGKSASVTPGPPAMAFFENPQTGSFQSGAGLLYGWSCQGPAIAIVIDGGAPIHVPYGSTRPDTATACGDSNTLTGFGLLYNYNKLGNGLHSAQLFVNGQPIGSPSQFTVTAPAGEFLEGASKEVTVANFPAAGRTTTLIWQQALQNFVIKSVSP